MIRCGKVFILMYLGWLVLSPKSYKVGNMVYLISIYSDFLSIIWWWVMWVIFFDWSRFLFTLHTLRNKDEGQSCRIPSQRDQDISQKSLCQSRLYIQQRARDPVFILAKTCFSSLKLQYLCFRLILSLTFTLCALNKETSLSKALAHLHVMIESCCHPEPSLLYNLVIKWRLGLTSRSRSR